MASRVELNGSIDSHLLRDVLRAAHVLRALRPSQEHPLKAFTAAFGAKHEGRSVPLLQAVDDELGFDLNGQSRHPLGNLLADLQEYPTIQAENNGHEAQVSPTLLRLFENACLTGNYRQRLNDSNLNSHQEGWPTSMAAVLRLNVDGDIYFDTMIGSSSSRMLTIWSIRQKNHGTPQESC